MDKKRGRKRKILTRGFYRPQRLRALRRLKSGTNSVASVAKEVYDGKIPGYRRLENDREPDEDTLLKLCNFFNVKPEFFYILEKDLRRMEELRSGKRILFESLSDLTFYKLLLLESNMITCTDCSDDMFFLKEDFRLVSQVSHKLGVKTKRFILHKRKEIEYERKLKEGEKVICKNRLPLPFHKMDFGICLFTRDLRNSCEYEVYPRGHLLIPKNTEIVGFFELDENGIPFSFWATGNQVDINAFKNIIDNIQRCSLNELIETVENVSLAENERDLAFLKDTFIRETNLLFHLWLMRGRRLKDMEGDSLLTQLLYDYIPRKLET